MCMRMGETFIPQTRDSRRHDCFKQEACGGRQRFLWRVVVVHARGEGGEGAAYPIVACPNHMNIDHASLARRRGGEKTLATRRQGPSL